MSPNVLEEKKRIAVAAERAVLNTQGVSLVPAGIVGSSYPYTRDVPGVWVRGPDADGRYTVELHVSFVGRTTDESLLDRSKKLRSVVWEELRGRDLAGEVTSVDIFVEDVDIAV